MKKVLFFVCCHKPFEQVCEKFDDNIIYITSCKDLGFDPKFKIYTSNYKFEKELGIGYSECAKIRYIWHYLNDFDCDYIGICHYRRYFDFMLDNDNDNIDEFVDNIFKTKKIILPNQVSFVENQLSDRTHIKNNYDVFCYDHNKTNIDTAFDVINTYYPEFNKGVEEFKASDTAYHYNMSVMTKKDFNDYCTFVFGVIDKVSEILGIEKDDKVKDYIKNEIDKGGYPTTKDENAINWQARLHGFIMERLSCIYFLTRYKETERQEYAIKMDKDILEEKSTS